MRVVLLLALVISISCTAPTVAGDVIGVWQAKPDLGEVARAARDAADGKLKCSS